MTEHTLVKRVDYAGHIWVRDGAAWVNPETGIRRIAPKFTIADAYTGHDFPAQEGDS